jgi:hypothetical protein
MDASDARNDSTDRWMRRDQADRVLDFIQELLPKAGAPAFIPSNFGPDLRLGVGVRPNRLPQRPRISTSIWRRTSSQSAPTVRPLSRSAHRRSISAAHAASTSSSRVLSRLSRSRAATSARCPCGSRRASSITRSILLAMSGSLADPRRRKRVASKEPAPPPTRFSPLSRGCGRRGRERGGGEGPRLPDQTKVSGGCQRIKVSHLTSETRRSRPEVGKSKVGVGSCKIEVGHIRFRNRSTQSRSTAFQNWSRGF